MTERILELVFRHKILLSLPIVLGFAGGLFALSRSEASYYSSRAAIWVERPTDLSGAALAEYNSYMTPADNQASAMRELMGLNSFAEDVVERAGMQSRGPDPLLELRANTFIYPYGAHVLYVEHRSQDARQARDAVQAVIDTYAALYTAQLKDRAARSKAFYEDLLKSTRTALEQASSELRNYTATRPALANIDLSNPPSTALRDAEFARLVAAEQAARANYNETLQKYAESQISASTASGAIPNFLVMDQPEVPEAKVQPGKRALLMPPAFGLAAGLMFSAIGFVIYWRLDTRIHLAQDLAFLDRRVPVMTLPALQARGRRWPASFVRIASALQSGLRPLG